MGKSKGQNRSLVYPIQGRVLLVTTSSMQRCQHTLSCL